MSGSLPDIYLPFAIFQSGELVSEGSGGGTKLLRLVLSTTITYSTGVSYTTVAGSATEGADYLRVSGSFVLSRATSGTVIEIPVVRDNVHEGTEQFFLRLSIDRVFGGQSANPLLSLAIADDDPLPVMSLSGPPAVLEGDAGSTRLVYTATRTGDLTLASSAAWAVSGFGTAPANAADFGGALASGRVSFAPGESSKSIEVFVTGDRLPEGNESFQVALSGLSGATPGPLAVITTIQDEDAVISIENPPVFPPDIRFLVPPVTEWRFLEGNAGAPTTASFTLTRGGGTTLESRVGWRVDAPGGPNQADAADFLGGVLPTGTVVFAPGETSKTIGVALAPDAVIEGRERFTVTLADPLGATLGTASSPAFILNDDGDLSITGPAAGAVEGQAFGASLNFTVRRSVTSLAPTSFTYEVLPTGANPASPGDFAGGDSGYVVGEAMLLPGQVEITIPIDIAGDLLVEGDETFLVRIRDVVGANLGVSEATGTILDDETTLSITGPASVVEGTATLTTVVFTVTRAGSPLSGEELMWEVTGAGVFPTENLDFDVRNSTLGTDSRSNPPGGWLSFAPGEATKTISVLIAQDTKPETDEAFEIRLLAANTFGPVLASAQVVIQDDDPGGLSLIGSGFGDTLTGRLYGDTLDGHGGNDLLEGNAGNDVLRGGPGNDTLFGGGGRDLLEGGAGADLFRYTRTLDSRPTATLRDRIEGFSAAEGDRIDLTAIDASTAHPRDQAFLWIGAAPFSGRVGELRFSAGLLQADTNGDGLADLEILLARVGVLPETALLL